MSTAQPLTITLDADTLATLRDFAAQMGQGLEGTAAALLTAELVRCTEAEHGPERAGRIFTRGELLHADLVETRARAAALQAALDRLRREARTLAQALSRLADE